MCVCVDVSVCVRDIHYLLWARVTALCKFSIIPRFEVRAMGLTDTGWGRLGKF